MGYSDFTNSLYAFSNLVYFVGDLDMKKEAEEWVNKNKPVQDDWEDSDIIQAIIDTSEPREKRIEELEKENAELKERNKELLESCEGATMMYNDLCKAKEIIKSLMLFAEIDCREYEEAYKKAEQFLNSEVEK